MATVSTALALSLDFYIITIMPKKVDHKERRRAFTEAAIEVIAERGLDALRLVDVARAAGVTTGSLTHYFNDKDQSVAYTPLRAH
ncbi:MAG: TetR family transcriptional regulator, partial [Kangiella sp.]|nr:TetR family transcriptional regulator [Kangiella sp.]